MKTSLILGSLAAAIGALPNNAVAWEMPARNAFTDQHRHLMHGEGDPVTYVFEECVNLNVNACIAIINEAIEHHPDDFSFLPQTGAAFDIERIRLQQDLTSNLVGIRMDMNETLAEGVLGDGMIFYPFPWCTNANKYYHCETDITFDCGVGGLLNYTECCDLIKNDPRVKNPDLNGDSIGCYADFPIGSLSNPRVEDRVFINVDENDIVVHPPKME